MQRAMFNKGEFYAAVDKVRMRRKLNWKQVAAQSGVTASTLTRIGQGKRPDVDGLAALAFWGGLNLNKFIVPPTEGAYV